MAKLKMILWILKVRPKVMKQSQKNTEEKVIKIEKEMN